MHYQKYNNAHQACPVKYAMLQGSHSVDSVKGFLFLFLSPVSCHTALKLCGAAQLLYGA